MAGVKRTLSVDLQGFVLPTPVMIAAGCSGTGRELSGLVDLRKVGAVVSRSITLEADRGSPTPRIAETAAGIVWSTGLQNPGIDVFVEQELPRLARTGSHVVVSITGTTLEEYVRLTGSLQGRPEVSAIEVYLSGPDGRARSRRPRRTRRSRRRGRGRGGTDVVGPRVREAADERAGPR